MSKLYGLAVLLAASMAQAGEIVVDHGWDGFSFFTMEATQIDGITDEWRWNFIMSADRSVSLPPDAQLQQVTMYFGGHGTIALGASLFDHSSGYHLSIDSDTIQPVVVPFLPGSYLPDIGSTIYVGVYPTIFAAGNSAACEHRYGILTIGNETGPIDDFDCQNLPDAFPAYVATYSSNMVLEPPIWALLMVAAISLFGTRHQSCRFFSSVGLDVSSGL